MARRKGVSLGLLVLAAVVVTALFWLGRSAEPFQGGPTVVTVEFKRAQGRGQISGIQVQPQMLTATSPGFNTLMIAGLNPSLQPLTAIRFERVQAGQTAFSGVADDQVDNNQATKIRFDLGNTANKLRKAGFTGQLMRGHKKLPVPISELGQGFKVQNLSEGNVGSLNYGVDKNMKMILTFGQPSAPTPPTPAPAPPPQTTQQ